MPLPRDPDILRVPAFMRKRNLRVRAKRPLVLTAFDRKQAGEVLPVLAKPVKKKPKTATKVRCQQFIGAITHYYDKIKVGVIKLTGALSVGDCIEYQTDEGPYSQIVESMEINREPAFKARSGKEVGLKLRKIPRTGTFVNIIK